jgi:hypothetical protein
VFINHPWKEDVLNNFLSSQGFAHAVRNNIVFIRHFNIEREERREEREEKRREVRWGGVTRGKEKRGDEMKGEERRKEESSVL